MNPAELGDHLDDPDFDIRLDRHGDVTLLSLTGRLDAVACLILKQYVVGALVCRIPPLVVVDLAHLWAIDGCGSEILVSASHHARAAGGRLVITGGEVLHSREVGDVEVFSSVADALAELTHFP